MTYTTSHYGQTWIDASIDEIEAAPCDVVVGAEADDGSVAKDDPLLTKVLIDQFEVRDADDGDPWVLDGQGWIGKDLQKLWEWTAVDADRTFRWCLHRMFELS